MNYASFEYTSIYFTICAGILSHLVLFICFVKDPLKCFRNSSTYLIMSLALSDLTACIVGLMKITAFSNFGSVLTSFSLMKTIMLVSLFSMVSIAIDRYLLTVHPFRHRVLLNKRRIGIWIISVWLLSCIQLVKDLTFDVNEKIDNIVYETVFVVVSLATTFIYIITYVSLKRQGRNISGQTQSGRLAAQKQFLKTIMVVAFIQNLTLVPTSMENLIRIWKGQKELAVIVISFQLFCLNFAINPFLYIWRLKNYRRTFMLVVKKLL